MRPFLERLRLDNSKVPAGLEQVVIASLFDVGDDLEAQVERSFDVSDSLQAEFLIQDLLERLEPSSRLPVLRSAIESSSGVILPASFVRLMSHSNRRSGGSPLTEAELQTLGPTILHRIEDLAAEDRLPINRHLPELLVAWDEWGDIEHARAWAARKAETPEGFAALAETFYNYGRGRGGNQHPLVDYIDLEDALNQARDWITDESVDDETRQKLTAVLTYIENYHSRYPELGDEALGSEAEPEEDESTEDAEPEGGESQR
jgi:hypothetical protein